MAFPPPTMVTTSPSIVQTSVFELVYVIAPSLLDVGGTKLNDASPNVFSGTEKPVRTVMIRSTCRVAVIVPDTKFAVLS